MRTSTTSGATPTSFVTATSNNGLVRNGKAQYELKSGRTSVKVDRYEPSEDPRRKTKDKLLDESDGSKSDDSDARNEDVNSLYNSIDEADCSEEALDDNDESDDDVADDDDN